MIKNQENFLIFHNIRSAQNVGAMFRTADAVGISKIYLTGYTPAPLDRFHQKRSDIAKTALGAENFIPWKQEKSLTNLINKLKRAGFLIIALEQDKKSIDYKKVKLGLKNVFLVGPEVAGFSSAVLKKCNLIAEIPMQGKKESLNVSVALGIFLYRVLNI